MQVWVHGWGLSTAQGWGQGRTDAHSRREQWGGGAQKAGRALGGAPRMRVYSAQTGRSFQSATVAHQLKSVSECPINNQNQHSGKLGFLHPDAEIVTAHAGWLFVNGTNMNPSVRGKKSTLARIFSFFPSRILRQISEAARGLQRAVRLVSCGFLEERRFYIPKEARVPHEQGTCFQDVKI